MRRHHRIGCLVQVWGMGGMLAASIIALPLAVPPFRPVFIYNLGARSLFMNALYSWLRFGGFPWVQQHSPLARDSSWKAF